MSILPSRRSQPAFGQPKKAMAMTQYEIVNLLKPLCRGFGEGEGRFFFKLNYVIPEFFTL